MCHLAESYNVPLADLYKQLQLELKRISMLPIGGYRPSVEREFWVASPKGVVNLSCDVEKGGRRFGFLSILRDDLASCDKNNTCPKNHLCTLQIMQMKSTKIIVLVISHYDFQLLFLCEYTMGFSQFLYNSTRTRIKTQDVVIYLIGERLREGTNCFFTSLLINHPFYGNQNYPYPPLFIKWHKKGEIKWKISSNN